MVYRTLIGFFKRCSPPRASGEQGGNAGWERGKRSVVPTVPTSLACARGASSPLSLEGAYVRGGRSGNRGRTSENKAVPTLSPHLFPPREVGTPPWRVLARHTRPQRRLSRDGSRPVATPPRHRSGACASAGCPRSSTACTPPALLRPRGALRDGATAPPPRRRPRGDPGADACPTTGAPATQAAVVAWLTGLRARPVPPRLDRPHPRGDGGAR